MIKWIEERRKRKRNEFIYKINQNIHSKYNSKIYELVNVFNSEYEDMGWKVKVPPVGTVYCRTLALSFNNEALIETIFDGRWKWAFCVDSFKRNMQHEILAVGIIPERVRESYTQFTKDVEDLLVEMTSKIKEEEY